MKTIIAGSRTLKNYLYTKQAIKESGFNITEVICGEAIGPDSYGKTWALLNDIPFSSYPVTQADWNTYGKSAGMHRNRKMGEVGEQLILVWDGISKGSKNMYDIAKAKGIPIYVKTVNINTHILPDEENWQPDITVQTSHWTDNYYGNQ